jgi:tripartite ATP-independent transporter DctM subunit
MEEWPVSDQPTASRSGKTRLAQTGNRVLNSFDYTLQTVCVLLLSSAVFVALLQVFFRYVLNASLSWPEEFARWAFVWLVFLGMAVTLHRNAHVSIDVVVRHLSTRWRRVQALFADSVVAATCIAFAVHGMDLVGRTIYVSPAMGLHFRFLYSAAPVGAMVSLLFLLGPRKLDLRYPLEGILRLGFGAGIYLLLRELAPAVLGGFAPSWLLVVTAAVLVTLGTPIAFALALSSFVAFFPGNRLLLLTVTQNLTSGIDSFILLAIPFFILAAGFMNVGGITSRLVRTAAAFVGHLKGGLAHVNVVTSVLMGGLTGSSSADAAATSKVLVPEMSDRGYPKPFSCAITAASSVLANLIPPSLALILYGALASVSVGALFLATIVPGLLVALALGIVVYILSVRRGYGSDIEKATGAERWVAVRGALPALILPIGIVGGVRFGVFTATEAGAVAVLYAIGISYIFYRRLRLSDISVTLRDAMVDTASIMVIVAAAVPFAWVLVSQQVPQRAAMNLAVLIDRPALLLLAINIFLLIVGLFMEIFASMVILVPLFIPIIMAAGIDPVHFGIILVANLVIGALTPPLGVLTFITARVTGTDVGAVFRAVVPFLVGMILVLLLITYVPAFSLALPNLVRP